LLFFGHIGFGHGLVTPWRRAMTFWMVTLGALLPDIIDKSLYYLSRGHFVSTTRTFGHTGIAVLLCWALARRYQPWLGVATGATTHVLLDLVLDPFSPAGHGMNSEWIALTWPLHGLAFPPEPYTSLRAHLGQRLDEPLIIATEILGLTLTFWALRRRVSYASGRSARTR
jgi:hypothetical protein